MISYLFDGCQYSSTQAYPILSESPELDLCDFEYAYAETNKNKFSGRVLYMRSRREWENVFPPSFMTVDEWYKAT
jgi:hypothetical protein